MTSQLLLIASLVLVVVILASILGAIEYRERFVFVAGIALFILAHTALPSLDTIGVLLSVVGILLAAGSTVPLLRQSI